MSWVAYLTVPAQQVHNSLLKQIIMIITTTTTTTITMIKIMIMIMIMMMIITIIIATIRLKRFPAHDELGTCRKQV